MQLEQQPDPKQWDKPQRYAHGIEELADQGPFGRSTIWKAIKAGKIKAKKFGKRTVILESEWQRFLTDLPDAVPAKQDAA